MLGAIVLAIGYGLVAWSGHDAAVVYMGMATIAVGNGLFKANPSSLLSTCYSKDDPRLDGAFTHVLHVINIGSFFSMLATPWLAAKFGWSVAFALSFVGMLITVVNFLFCRSWVKDYGSKPDFEPVHMGKLLATIVGVVISRPSPPGCCITRVLHVPFWAWWHWVSSSSSRKKPSRCKVRPVAR
ncbi:tripeptide transporter permease [Enterobacter cloacae]|uniref:Tripeptide transporter permease n=1 Tax=Enterobacter cloacae TaxID=550 RepID=A0A377M2D1_ENTCL|nr:tripeptide transporter permease [Enterobacter cloacae]